MGNCIRRIIKQGQFKAVDDREGSPTRGQTITISREKFLCMSQDRHYRDDEKIEATVSRTLNTWDAWENRPTLCVSERGPSAGEWIKDAVAAVFDEYVTRGTAGRLLPRKGLGPRWTLVTCEQFDAVEMESVKAQMEAGTATCFIYKGRVQFHYATLCGLEWGDDSSFRFFHGNCPPVAEEGIEYMLYQRALELQEDLLVGSAKPWIQEHVPHEQAAREAARVHLDSLLSRATQEVRETEAVLAEAGQAVAVASRVAAHYGKDVAGAAETFQNALRARTEAGAKRHAAQAAWEKQKRAISAGEKLIGQMVYALYGKQDVDLAQVIAQNYCALPAFAFRETDTDEVYTEARDSYRDTCGEVARYTGLRCGDFIVLPGHDRSRPSRWVGISEGDSIWAKHYPYTSDADVSALANALPEAQRAAASHALGL